MPHTTNLNPNLAAFLDCLAHSEGTTHIKGGGDGYRVIVGGSTFHDFRTHPRLSVNLRSGLKSTAAGRYQMSARTFEAYKKLLKLKDFSPGSQDAIAIQQIKEQGALADIEQGRFDATIAKCRNIWPGLTRTNYG